MTQQERLPFEDALKRLQDILETLEDEELSLNESVSLYEEGVALAKQCSDTLDSAKQRIEKVTLDNQTN